jgi:hypothetical protein
MLLPQRLRVVDRQFARRLEPEVRAGLEFRDVAQFLAHRGPAALEPGQPEQQPGLGVHDRDDREEQPLPPVKPGPRVFPVPGHDPVRGPPAQHGLAAAGQDKDGIEQP